MDMGGMVGIVGMKGSHKPKLGICGMGTGPGMCGMCIGFHVPGGVLGSGGCHGMCQGFSVS